MHFPKVSQLKPSHLAQLIVLLVAYAYILPLFPDIAIGPYQAINPLDVAHLTFAIIVIATVGNIAMELASRHHALLLTGFLGGFTSSTATIIAMGSLAKRKPELARNAASAAIVSSISTYIQMAVLVGLTSPATLFKLALPLLVGCLVTIVYCRFSYRPAPPESRSHSKKHNPFAALKRGLIVVVVLTFMLVVVAGVEETLGERGLYVATFLSGFVDGHASAISVSEMVALGRISIDNAMVPILLGLTSNTLVRSLVSLFSMSRKFSVHVITALMLSNILTWITLWAVRQG